MDSSGPVEILPPLVPNAHHGVTYRYANGVVMVHGGPSGCTFTGTDGTLRIDRDHLTSDPAAIVKEPLGSKDVHLEKSPGHHRNWLDCIRSRKRPLADVEIGARSVAITILGNLAYWNGRHPSTLGPGQVGVCGRCRGQPLARPQAPGPVAASGRLRGAWSPMPARGRKTLTRAIPRP